MGAYRVRVERTGSPQEAHPQLLNVVPRLSNGSPFAGYELQDDGIRRVATAPAPALNRLRHRRRALSQEPLPRQAIGRHRVRWPQ